MVYQVKFTHGQSLKQYSLDLENSRNATWCAKSSQIEILNPIIVEAFEQVDLCFICIKRLGRHSEIPNQVYCDM